MSRYNRTNFYTEKEYDGSTILDFTTGTIQNLKIKRPTSYYTIRYEDIARPDLLSYKIYGKIAYWYLLAEVNDIFDWWNDIEEGDVIQVIDEKDIQDWYLDNK